MSEWKKMFPNVENDEDLKMMEPYIHYALKVSKRGILKKFMKTIDEWFQIPKENLQRAEDIVEVIHHTILLIDDIQDDFVLRRRDPAAHSIYGIQLVLNAAQFGYLTSYAMALSKENSKLFELLTSRVMKGYEGQGMDIYWRENSICPTEEEYKQMVSQKTGCFFELAVQLMLDGINNITSDLLDFVFNFSLHFQIKDDYFSLTSEVYTEEKSFCEDITEGKFSFPLIHAIRARPDDDRILNILKRKTRDVETKKFVVSLLKEYNSLDYTKSVIEEMGRKLKKMLENMPENRLMIKIVDSDWG